MDRRLYKSRDNRMLAGVCGGLAEYINADPTVVRIVFALVSVLSAAFPGIIIYIILAIIMPEKY
ncbi:MAG: PspC domain-containing protein [Acutalibacteraceae bacterium]|jgi:phage shock protein C|nr:PspC domain-containing protein [Clostridiales bacterium]